MPHPKTIETCTNSSGLGWKRPSVDILERRYMSPLNEEITIISFTSISLLLIIIIPVNETCNQDFLWRYAPVRRTGTFFQSQEKMRASIPLRQWCISPCFRFPPVPKIFQTPWKIFRISSIPENFSHFIRQNFWRPFSVIDCKFWFPPIFGVSVHFPLFIEHNCFSRLLKISPLIS